MSQANRDTSIDPTFRFAGLTALRWLASVELTLICLGLMMILVIFGTLAQVQLGTFQVQKEFFSSFFVYADVGGLKIPLLPGGLSVGGLWLINLVAAFIDRFRFRKRDTGILISHAGLIVLLFGQGLTQLVARESQMPIEIGQTRNYSESTLDSEIALTRTSDPELDTVISVPYHLFSRKTYIPVPGTTLTLVMKSVFKNAQLGMGATKSLATQGIGPQIAVQPTAPVSSDDETNNTTAFVEVLDQGKSLGVWLVSMALGAPQGFAADGGAYRIALRPRRHYYPFSLTLKEFHHDIYPGTDIPKNFSSLVTLNNPSRHDTRDALVYMNHPLRYQGLTFYQASFGKQDTLSVFQVVQNPIWLTPYIACALVILGLTIQFMSHLLIFARNRP
jgi:hypothetical protein